MCCWRYMRNKQDAEDMLQNGFLKFYKALDGFHCNVQEILHGYVKTIMINLCVDELKKKHTLYTVWEHLPPYTEVLENPFAEEDAQQIRLLITELPAGFRVVFNLYAVDGYTHKEIGEMLDISENTSRSQYKRARTVLQTKLAEIKKSNNNEGSK